MNNILVIHVNAFSSQILGGYLMDAMTKKRVGESFTVRQLVQFIGDNPKIKVQFLKV